MEENIVPNVQFDDLSVGDITLSSGNLEKPFGVPGSVTEAESATSDQHANSDEDLQPKVINFEFNTNGTEELHVTNQVDAEGMLEEKKEEHYDKLLEKVAKYEVELKSTKNKLQSSEEEIARLKNENLTLVEKLQSSAEKFRQYFEDHMSKIEHKLRNEIEQGQRQSQLHLRQMIYQGQAQLASEFQELKIKTKKDLEDYGRENEMLKLALYDAHKDASEDRIQFQYEISCLNEEKNALELKQKVLEEQINHYKSEKIEAGTLHEAREAALLDEIKHLKIELSQQSSVVETLNPNLDANNLKNDTVMAEKDDVLANVT